MPPVDGPSPLLTLALVLVVGIVFGELAKRVRLPAVTGQIVGGIVLGPAGLGLFGLPNVHALEPVLEFALMAVAAGSHLRLRRLANAKQRLGLLVLFEATLTPTLVFTLTYFVGGASLPLALLLATIAVATAPATILALVRETRAKGVFVKTLVAGVALNNLACIVLFELARTVARAQIDTGADLSLAGLVYGPLRQLGPAALLGCGAGGVLVACTRRIVRPDRVATMSMVAILLVAGLAPSLGISPLLPCLFLGVTLANLTPTKEEIGHTVFANFEVAIFAAFFTLAGMELSLGNVLPGGVLALLMFAGRAAGKLVSGWCAMKLGRATRKVRRLLGMALVPQAGLAVGLMLLVTDDPAFSPIHKTVLAVVLTVVLANEIVGPILTRVALQMSGETGLDRPRVIDFLHEEHIVTGFTAATKEEAIARLTDHLIATRKLRTDREQLLAGFLEREQGHSTCLGEGLAIPHGPLEHGNDIVGVMGISREGLPLSTPDGMPVHCMVLLATPPGAGDRHLQVVAALARAIGADPNLRNQLFDAKTPAHAYELLHAGEAAEDFNHFLDSP